MSGCFSIAYKFFAAGLLLFGCGAIFAEPLLGILLIVVAVGLFGAQQRRDKKRDEERRHREIIDAMSKGNNTP